MLGVSGHNLLTSSITVEYCPTWVSMSIGLGQSGELALRLL